jgi:1,2-phenylacetyl-CoA epoxidase catalytic subunit
MISGKQFVEKIKKDNSELFNQSRKNVRRFFNSNPSKEHMIQHFRGRMVNEAMNMKAIAAEVASAPTSMDVTELELLTKQAQDEAKHFRMVMEVMEYISGEIVDVDAAFAAETADPQAKGATLLDKYGASSDPAALAAYQLVAEGRAEAVWNEMAECIEDPFISSRYAAIAKDEGFHSNIGGWKLEKLVEGSADVQERILAIVDQMRVDLLDISNKNTSLPFIGV